jgi:hypothetical protein
MHSLRQVLISLILLAVLASSAYAQGAKPHRTAPAGTTHSVLTGKERLGRKWTDEQRIDNCNVPVDKRGTRPRPDACSDAPPS